MDIFDDHSRLVVAAHVCAGPTGDASWGALCDGAARHGLPAHVMSDNGSCFTGRFSNGEAAFERDLRALGVRHIRSTPGHPQTCGKLERFHQTLKRWLRDYDKKGRDEVGIYGRTPFGAGRRMSTRAPPVGLAMIAIVPWCSSTC